MKTEKNTALYSRIKGVLIGGAYGDAMGMPTEFWTQEHIRSRFPQGIDGFLPSQPDDFFGRSMSAGEITDDTINTVMIADMIAENHGTINTESYLKRLIAWKNESEVAALVCGPSTLKALEAIERGVSVEVTGKLGTTNGAAMKISPVGILSDYRRPDALIGSVSAICKPSHNTSIAIQGASVVAAMVSYAVSGGNDIPTMWELAEEISVRAKPSGFQIPSASLTERMKLAKQLIQNRTAAEAMKKLYDVVGTGVETIETIPSVLAVIKLSEGDPLASAKISASLGGDTDTIGAISTAICGGMNPGFPDSLVRELENVNHLDFDRLSSRLHPFSPYA
ncbi:ADP-ribosylglycohydrolase family protein [Clostridium sp. KNHs216]|uniref:ADP-ribosylglycohydrolase family protein n=1 Tax=Clostridium sp. KNHs216 TaxID=1550235 RepID=UPI00114EEE5D|nr:ADP-ribosylglycohydrolase family protein [Clostridium sp. KNHs216]TQI67435.1 ADP-ribosylglycohydrolase [Clostridium sp. KNHs216]